MRRSLRLRNYDYSRSGAYFVTICTRDRKFVYGDVRNGEMFLNEAGRLVEAAWHQLPQRFPTVRCDALVILPNHVHGILLITCPDSSGTERKAPALGHVVQAFKSISAIQVNRLLSRSGRPLWQRNYYEHIIRDDTSLDQIRRYIRNNPFNWKLDRENPLRTGTDPFDKRFYGSL